MEGATITYLAFFIVFAIYLIGLGINPNAPYRFVQIGIASIGCIAFLILLTKSLPSTPTDKKVKTKADQLAFLSAKYDAASNARRALSEYLGQQSTLTTPDILPEEQMLINFYVLGCRLSGYLGPMDNGYFDANVAVQYAVKAGCRALFWTLILWNNVCHAIKRIILLILWCEREQEQEMRIPII